MPDWRRDFPTLGAAFRAAEPAVRCQPAVGFAFHIGLGWVCGEAGLGSPSGGLGGTADEPDGYRGADASARHPE